MSIVSTVADAVLMACSVATVKANHTEARTAKEKKKKQDLRIAISDARNIVYGIKKFIR